MCSPCLHFQVVAQLIDRLVMRAVYFGKTMRHPTRASQRLNIAMLLVGQIMSLNVELERAAEGDIEDLKTFANCQNWQSTRERVLHSLKLPAVALRVDLFIQHRRIGNFLSQKLRRNIGAAGK